MWYSIDEIRRKTVVRDMKTRRLLIADESVDFCSALTVALGGAFELRVCHDGAQAVRLLEQFRPDVLVLDLILPQLDGYVVLNAAASLDNPPRCLVVSGFISAYVQRLLNRMNVDYILRKPCDYRTLADRIRDLSGTAEGVIFTSYGVASQEMRLLSSLNISGNRALRTMEAALKLYMSNPVQSVTKELYPALAKQLGTSAQAVEKAIRTAINKAWLNRNEATWRMFFPANQSGRIPKPTNLGFLNTLSAYLQGCTLGGISADGISAQN